jgi:hypothetical protein
MTATMIQAGQWSAALGCVATAAWWAARRGAWGVCGGWLGVLGAFKPFVAPVALWVLLDRGRARRALVPMVLGATLPFVAGLAVFGVDAHAAWLEQARDIEWLWTPWSASVHGFLVRITSARPFAPLSQVPPAVTVFSWILAAGILATSVWRVRRADVDRAFALLWVASLLAFPLGWIYYGWLAFAPIYALYEDGRLKQPLARMSLWLLTFPPALLWAGQERLWGATGASVYFWATCGIWMATWSNRTGDAG